MEQTLNEIKVSYRRRRLKANPVISCAADAVVLLRKLYNPDTIGLQEQFIVLYLNRANEIIGVYHLSTGGLNGTVADIRLVLAVGLKVAASNIIISHNHPSGNMTASKADIHLTNKLRDACRLMDMQLLEHIIMGPGGRFCKVE